MTTILVVDDSALDRTIAGACVEQEGLSAIYAEDGRQALDVLQRDRPDMVLTDLRMPEMDGLQLVREVRQHHANVPVILMTAHGSEEIAVEALNAGAASYVPKKTLQRDLGDALQAIKAALAATDQRDQVREFLTETGSHFVLGYERGGPQALISYLRDELTLLNFCDQGELLRISTALTEAIANAIDHGNLELDSSLREAEGNVYRKLGYERMKQSPYRDRRVYVTSRLAPSEAVYIVRDEGPGFDVSTLPDPSDPENILKPFGRGVMLIRTFMDEVHYNDKGDELTMIKRRAPTQ